jgi:hypothetical protein
MRIGVDFDNTLVSYDALFHRVAIERELVPAHTPATKVRVRNHLRETGREAVWTEMQGYVYGARMAEAEPYPGALDFLAWAQDRRADIYIVSHKTRHPFIGPAYDLHQAASEWVRCMLMDRPRPLVSASAVFLELTKDEKLARIEELRLDFFIDDLPEILLAPTFPSQTTGLLFNPDGFEGSQPGLVAFRTWADLKAHIETQWTIPR